jgi:sensor histidine kinase regulating citrate/malate metabolism
LYYFKEAIWFDLITVTLIFILAENHFNIMKKNYEERMKEYQDKVVGQQVDEVQNIYLTMRGWRHDYHNHMQTLKAHLAMNRYDLLEEYLNLLEQDLDSIDFLIKSGNINLDAILNSKLSLASAKSISINCKAQVPKKFTVSDIDLCVLIGNLLDNAMEACDLMEEGETKFLRVYIGILKQQLYISVTNSTKELVRNISSEYISKKRGNHGHGLKRIDHIVKRYEGFINRKNEPGVFVTEIMLPL